MNHYVNYTKEFKSGNNWIYILNIFSYFNVVFTTGRLFIDLQNTLTGQVRKGMFQMQKYLNQFVFLKPSQMCDMFDKLIHTILSCACEVCSLIQKTTIERVH